MDVVGGVAKAARWHCSRKEAGLAEAANQRGGNPRLLTASIGWPGSRELGLLILDFSPPLTLLPPFPPSSHLPAILLLPLFLCPSLALVISCHVKSGVQNSMPGPAPTFTGTPTL